jgi:excisionase family DNA binding protein
MELALQDRPTIRPLRVHQVAKRLNKSRRTVRHLAQTGELRAFKTGPKLWAFSTDDVEAYQAEMEAYRGLQ